MIFIKEYKTHLKIAASIWMVSLILGLLAYVMVLRQQNNSKKRLESTLAEQKQLHASARRAAQKQSRDQLNEQIERLRDQIEGFAIDHEKFTDLTFDISQIANRENLSSFSVATSKKKSAGRRGAAARKKGDTNHINENLIDITFTAGFQQFAIFVNTLERHRPVLFVDEFKITRSRKDDSMYQVDLDVTAFVRKQQNNETAETASASTLSAKL